MTKKNGNGNGHEAPDVPTYPDAEAGMIGFLMMDPDLILSVPWVGREDFWSPEGKEAITAIASAKQRAAGARTNWEMVIAELNRTGTIAKCPKEWLQAAIDRASNSGADLDMYARRVREVADRRRVIVAAEKVVGAARHGHDVDKAMDRLRQACTPPPWMQPNRLKVTNMEDVQERKLDWLWPQRLLRGHLNLLGGSMGAGKSAVMCNLTGRVTTGSPWPRVNDIDTDETVKNTPGNVAFLCLEAGAADELKPRLRVAGADMKRIKIIEGRIGPDGLQVVDLVNDLDAIRREIHDALPDGLTMLVIDPVIDFLPGVKVNDDEELHRALQPLMRFAQECKVCVVMIVHDNKRMDASAQDKTAGARAFVSMSRTSFRVDRDRTDPAVKRIMMLPIKCNYMKDEFGMGAVIYPSEDDGEYPAVRWEAEPVRKTADEVLREKFKQKNNKSAAAFECAEKFLKDKGPSLAADLLEHCKATGDFSDSSVKRGLTKQGAETRKIGKVWWWKLKDQEWPKEEPNLLNQVEKKDPF